MNRAIFQARHLAALPDDALVDVLPALAQYARCAVVDLPDHAEGCYPVVQATPEELRSALARAAASLRPGDPDARAEGGYLTAGILRDRLTRIPRSAPVMVNWGVVRLVVATEQRAVCLLSVDYADPFPGGAAVLFGPADGVRA